jgi:hypothetical protein
MTEDRQLLKWQRRMAPFMTACIIAAAGFFAVITMWQFASFKMDIGRPADTPADLWGQQTIAPTTYEQQLDLARARAAFALERELIARRYSQANLTLTTRVWTRLMGFITGMILGLVGAAFILGKLSEDFSEATAKAGPPGQEWMFSLRSASPGIVLVVMGTLLMALSISIQATYSVKDQAIYFGRVGQSQYLRPDEAIGPAGAEDLNQSIEPPGTDPSRKEAKP